MDQTRNTNGLISPGAAGRDAGTAAQGAAARGTAAQGPAADRERVAADQLAGQDPSERLANLLDVLAEVFRADPRRTTASISNLLDPDRTPEGKEILAALELLRPRQ